MDAERRAFLDELLATPTPAGYEARGQRVWVDYVSAFADEVHTDAYGNAVAVVEGGATEFAVAGHGDQIGLVVTDVDGAFVHVEPIGGADRTVTKGQHVTVHTDDGTVPGVVGQTAIHLREDDDEHEDISEQFVDVGADDEDAARDLVSVGDPVTITGRTQDLAGERVAARGMDNRVGIWVAAEALRRAAERDVDATVAAVSTVQEEVGLKGAQMVGYDLDPDAVVAVDVTHASDSPAFPSDRHADVTLGGGPVVTRGSSNHPALVDAARDGADGDVQVRAAGTRTSTDTDAFYVQRGGVPALSLGIPNRYMHTPVEVVDLRDVDAAATLCAAMAAEAHDRTFAVDV
ncbi:MAG: M20/M25/M40 family metallo-hydrolase [Halobacteriaceae archaeon]